jgi:hypothetical protein
VIVLVGRPRIGSAIAGMRGAVGRLGARFLPRPDELGSAASDGH